MLSVPDSVIDIKLCSTSCDGSEVTPSNNQGVEMIVEVSTEGEQSSMMPVIAIMYLHLWHNLFCMHSQIAENLSLFQSLESM